MKQPEMAVYMPIIDSDTEALNPISLNRPINPEMMDNIIGQTLAHDIALGYSVEAQAL